MGEARPVRLQLSRKPGFNLQVLSLATNGLPAINVARPGKWGNPFRVTECNDPRAAVAAYRRLFEQKPSRLRHLILRIASGNKGRGEGHLAQLKASLPELRGKNLACWCAPGAPCHADVLIELSNRPICEAA